jgi:tetratricopeptide (TPR) repeat protein
MAVQTGDDSMSIKGKLTQLLAEVRRQELALGDRLSQAEREQGGVLEHWSVKDNLAHIATWRITLARNLAAVRSGQEPQRTQDYDQANAEIFAAHQGYSWEQVLTESENAYNLLLAEIQTLNDADLNSIEYFPWLEGRPLWRGIAGNSALHPLTHLAGYYIENGRGAEGLDLYESALPLLSALDDNPGWQGMVHYDFACLLALVGEKAQALATLGEALELAPEFVEWSKLDSDLENLRQEPGYQALYK